MTDKERLARIVGFLEGFSAYLWSIGDERLASETVAQYSEYVEELRMALFPAGNGGKDD